MDEDRDADKNESRIKVHKPPPVVSIHGFPSGMLNSPKMTGKETMQSMKESRGVVSLDTHRVGWSGTMRLTVEEWSASSSSSC